MNMDGGVEWVCNKKRKLRMIHIKTLLMNPAVRIYIS